MALVKELTLEWDISLKDKYLSMDKEKRIRRMQFFSRMLIPGILLAFFLYIPTVIATFIFSAESISQSSFYLNIIFNLIYLFVIFKYYPIIIQKRAHDFWKEWKIETYVLLGSAIINTFLWMYISYLTINMDLVMIMSIAKITSIISLISLLVWLYLLFRPWTKWTNKYWEQKYYKLKFLW